MKELNNMGKRNENEILKEIQEDLLEKINLNNIKYEKNWRIDAKFHNKILWKKYNEIEDLLNEDCYLDKIQYIEEKLYKIKNERINTHIK